MSIIGGRPTTEQQVEDLVAALFISHRQFLERVRIESDPVIRQLAAEHFAGQSGIGRRLPKRMRLGLVESRVGVRMANGQPFGEVTWRTRWPFIDELKVIIDSYPLRPDLTIAVTVGGWNNDVRADRIFREIRQQLSEIGIQFSNKSNHWRYDR